VSRHDLIFCCAACCPFAPDSRHDHQNTTHHGSRFDNKAVLFALSAKLRPSQAQKKGNSAS